MIRDRVRKRGVKECKPSVSLEEDGLAIAVLDDNLVAVLSRRAAVQWRRFPSLAAPPL